MVLQMSSQDWISQITMDLMRWNGMVESTKTFDVYADEVRGRIQMLFPMACEENLQDQYFPLASDIINTYREDDEELERLMASAERQNSERFTVREVDGVELIHDGNQIFVPAALRDRVLDWYHQMLVHSGEKRMNTSL